jgi:putative nucleotidyltransferase with HDIG domain
MAVVRGGLFTGLVGAATALLLHFVQVYLGNGEVVSVLTAQRPLWSIVAALMSGLLSTFLVLGLLPVFETFGFVTDYRMMELANLNHPLLRQLMLRAPGTYHHSVVVGSLAEAACEAIGANALQARVSAYFHDIGKSLRPQFFVENQRDGVNRHDGLDPRASAQILIHHVTDGAKMAREHRLPKPIIDNILMHHGTGLIQLFFARAAEDAAARGETVNEADFRYPGPMPDSREAGIVMLADKVEAATRTIKHPTEENLRAMISRIVSSVIADGQFSKCPLTVEEIYTSADTFVRVLLGIYHHRIEYPSTRDLSEVPRRPTGTVITLDMPTVPSTEVPVPPAQDYESVDHLPGS